MHLPVFVPLLMAAAGAADAPGAAAHGVSIYVPLLIALAVLIGPFVLGVYAARALKLPAYGWKLGVFFFAFIASVVIVWWCWPPKLGTDLSGGLTMVYEVDRTKLPKDKHLSKDEMEKLIEGVLRRINPSGVKEVTIRQFGNEQLEITIPNVKDPDEVKEIKKSISRIGSLAFRILATNKDHTQKKYMDHALAEKTATEIRNPEDGTTEGWWVPVAKGHESDVLTGDTTIATRQRTIGGEKRTEVFVIKDKYNVTGDDLASESSGIGQDGGPAVHFSFNHTGAEKFGGLTGRYSPQEGQEPFKYRLGIILDDELQTAPSLNSRITDSGEISGRSMTQKEVEATVAVLQAGSLPAALNKEPIKEDLVGPTLGRDTIRTSTRAMIISAILVPLFMVWYYRFAGLVANICLTLNMLVLVAVMLTVHAAFTLTGLAGLALAVGMAVDNNVLLYERMREELHRGAALRMAIRNAFHRVGVVIVDANLTHIIAATVLFVVGTEQVKGFAITFLLGALLSLWTSLFVARFLFEIAERKHWLTKLKMLHVIGDTHIDFMAWFPAAATFSLLITLVGLAVAFYRGEGLFDIDFTGGVSIEAAFRAPKDIAVVREAVEKTGLKDVAVNNVIDADHPDTGGKSTRFSINTSEQNKDKVREDLQKAFGDSLVTNKATVAGLGPITARAPGAKTPAKPPAETPAKPPAETPGKHAKAEFNRRLRDDLPPDSLLAAAGPAALALADPKAAAAPDKSKAAAPSSPSRAAVAEPFVGGTMATLTFDFPVNHSTATDMVAEAWKANEASLGIKAPTTADFELTNPEYVAGDRPYDSWDLKIKLPPEKAKKVLATLQEKLAAEPYFRSASLIGAAVAENTRWQAVEALVASWTLIIIYLWVRFQGVAFGLAAVVALIHDVLVMLGGVAFSYYIAAYVPPLAHVLMIDQFKVNLPIVAAFLTIIGYSVNDTIVVFDRIREVRGKDPRMTRQMVNDSTNQTLSRTLLTSFTVMLVVFVLYVAGGKEIHGFAFALLIGVLTGTYSSIYVAAPILLWLIHPKAMKKG